MAQDKITKISSSAWFILIGGATASHAASGYLHYALSNMGWGAWLGISAALVVGLTLTGWVYWSVSRPFAGVHYRVEVLAVLALSSVIYADWRSLAGFEGWSATVADFITSLAAFGIGLIVYKCLEPIDRNEAVRNAAGAIQGSPRGLT